MKKFLALIMVLCLTACGGSGSTEIASGVEDGVLTIAMECTYAPYSWTQNDDSNGAVPISNAPGSYANGYDVMIGKAIAEANGWELEVIQSDWDSLVPGVQNGKFDAVIAGQSMTAVILPQALRNNMPQIGNNFIINVKDTSVMFIIGFPDFFAAHRAAVGASYLYFPSATVEMVGYPTMTLIASFLLRWVEKKLDGSSNNELAQVDPLTMTAGTYNHPDRGTPFDERSKEYRENQKQAMKNRNFNKRGER